MNERLKEVVISVTNRCNSKCLMCEIPQGQLKDGISTKNLKKFIKDISLFHPRSMVFSGGEPLLREDILELIALSNKQGFITCIASNGRLIDDRKASELKKAGVKVVNISIDGPEDVHDFLRGEGGFNAAVRALKSLKRVGIEATVAMMVCRYNYSHMPYVVGLAAELGATTVKFQAFSDVFLKEKNKVDEFLISQTDFSQVCDSVKKAQAAAEEKLIALNPKEYLNLMPHYLCGDFDYIKRKMRGACFSLQQSCAVDYSGTVHPCWIFSEIAVGNINKTSILDIWNSKIHNEIKRRIITEGCPVCFLSCYDENYSPETGRAPTLKRRMEYLKKSGLFFSLKRLFLAMLRRIKRGALRGGDNCVGKMNSVLSEQENKEESARISKLKEILAEKINTL